ncbi:iron complex transport system permease protein [Micromonospora sp. Llam0]|uniref:FecCD family ABC transporter permease n=1 Tax=Micromonospora sp. Llam0 TaxID=2485143 RepID=UPI000FC03177|nr:iron ABC transporter permease [Micromonospora sp. Llam0]ROO60496.1 iron complex transport system permease protein [Micromonospora sp. Llam0]
MTRAYAADVRARNWPVAAVVTVACLTAAVSLGPVQVKATTVWSVAWNNTGGRLLAPVPVTWPHGDEQIVWLVRMPRAALAAVVGAALAAVGAVMQTLLRNPLADPYLLGVSSGASVGAAVVALLGALSSWGIYALPSGAFLGALLAVLLVTALGRRSGRAGPVQMVLAGVVVSYVLSAVTSYLVISSPDHQAVRGILFWLLGTVAGARWDVVALTAVVAVAGGAALLARARALNAISGGEESAATLGVDVARERYVLLGVCALMTAVAVAGVGAVGFVGLMAPHAVRLVMGADHRAVLPVAMLTGASFLVLADLAARTVAAPAELPLGVLTALCGGPFFLWLLLRRSGRSGLGVTA